MGVEIVDVLHNENDVARKDPRQEKLPIVPIAGKQVDLRKALPLTIKDAQELKKIGVVLSEIEEKPEIAYDLVRYVLKKADPTLDDETVNTNIQLRWAARIVEVVGILQTKEDIPF